MVSDLAAMPHLLIAGSTGSGKSVGLNTMICSLLYKATPAEVRFLLIDPKRLELGMYEGIPHLLAPVVTDAKEASARLKWIVGKMDERYKQLQLKQVRNIEGYNREVPAEEKLPYWVVVVDELADLMMVSAGEVQNSLVRLAQIARAVGIHLIIATQRPSVDVVTGLIKANFPTRIAFQVASKVDSRTVLDANGAEQLLGRGDMIFLPPGSGRATRVHGCWVADNEVKAICEFLRKQGSAVYEKVELPIDDGPGGGGDADRDDVYWDAVGLVIAQRVGVDLLPAAPARSGLSQGGALHRHDGAGPHHRARAGGQAARDPRRPRIPRAEGQVTRRMRRSLLVMLAAVVLAAAHWSVTGSCAGAGPGRGGARGDVWEDHRPARGVHPGREQQEPRAGHQGGGNGPSEEGRQDALGLQEPGAAADRLRRDVALGLHARAEPGEQGQRAEGAGRPAGSFLAGLGRVREEFTVRFLNPAQKADGAGRYVLDLVPKAPTPLLTRLVLSIDPKDYIVRQAVLYDQLQNTVTMTFTKVTPNAGLQDSLFVFTPPAGAAVVPLEIR